MTTSVIMSDASIIPVLSDSAKTIARADLLVLDDWGLKAFSADQHDILNSYRISLKGESMRKTKTRLT